MDNVAQGARTCARLSCVEPFHRLLAKIPADESIRPGHGLHVALFWAETCPPAMWCRRMFSGNPC